MNSQAAPAEVVAPAVPRRRITCRTFVPSDEHAIVVNQQEFEPPQGLTVTNWANVDVAHKEYDTQARDGRTACRDTDAVTEIIAHETVSPGLSRGSTGRPFIHFILHRDGTLTQHVDLVHDTRHANHHNRSSFGFETVNPVVPRLAGAPQNGLPPNLARWPVIQNTSWAGQDRHDPDRRRVRNPETGEQEWVNGPLPREPWNRDRHYVRPTQAQFEAAKLLIEWATDDAIGHGMEITRDWRGLRRDGELLLFGRDDALFATREPGIYAHGYFHHSDGYILVLYAWLRIEHNLDEQEAFDATLDLAENHTVQHRAAGGRRQWHADLTQAPAPGPRPPVPVPPAPVPGPPEP